MKELTQEMAERAARACGGYTKQCKNYNKGKVVTGWFTRDSEGTEHWICERDALSLNPLFWFPRLWEKLCEIADKAEESCEIKYYGGFDEVRYDGENMATEIANPCLALCSAIEALEKEDK